LAVVLACGLVWWRRTGDAVAAVGRLTVERGDDWPYYIDAPRVELNGKRVATLRQGEVFEAALEPGRAQIAVDLFGVPDKVALDITARAGSRHRVRINPNPAPRPAIANRSIVEHAAHAIQPCRRILREESQRHLRLPLSLAVVEDT